MMIIPYIDSIFAEIYAERIRQDKRFGGAEHDDNQGVYFFIQSIQDFAGWARQMAAQDRYHDMRERLIQVAALAVAAVESEDRKQNRKKNEFNSKAFKTMAKE